MSPKFLHEFPDTIFLGVAVESLLGEAEDSAFHTRVPVQKVHNFLSDRWISLKFSQEFPEAVFLGVYVESLLGEAEVSALQTGVQVLKRHNF